MIKPAKQTVAIVAALAMTAAPVLSCCFGLMGHAHAAMAASGPSGHTSHGSSRVPCAKAATKVDAARTHGADCDNCVNCDTVQPAARDTVAATQAQAVQSDFAPSAAFLPSYLESAPALLRATGPPHASLAVLRTPTVLNTTLRL